MRTKPSLTTNQAKSAPRDGRSIGEKVILRGPEIEPLTLFISAGLMGAYLYGLQKKIFSVYAMDGDVLAAYDGRRLDVHPSINELWGTISESFRAGYEAGYRDGKEDAWVALSPYLPKDEEDTGSAQEATSSETPGANT